MLASSEAPLQLHRPSLCFSNVWEASGPPCWLFLLSATPFPARLLPYCPWVLLTCSLAWDASDHPRRCQLTLLCQGKSESHVSAGLELRLRDSAACLRQCLCLRGPDFSLIASAFGKCMYF